MDGEPEMELLDTSFAKQTTDWNGDAVFKDSPSEQTKSKKTASVRSPQEVQTKATLQTAVLPSTIPIMRTISGKKVMVFQSLDENRDTINGSVLMFSVYNNEGWSTPQPVLDDGTADLYADLKEINGNLYLAWQNLADQLDSSVGDGEDAFRAVGQSSRIWFARFDENTDMFTDAREVPNSNQGSQPRLGEVGEDLAVSWVVNADGDMLQRTGSNKVMMSTQTGNSFTEGSLLFETDDMINDHIICNNQVFYTAEAHDTFETKQQNVVVCNQEGSVISDADCGEDGISAISELRSTGNKLTYLSNGTLYEYDTESQITESYLAGESSFGSNAQYCSNGDKSGYLWTEYDEDEDKGYLKASMRTDEGFSSPIIIDEYSGIMFRTISPSIEEDGTWAVISNAYATDTEENSLLYIAEKPVKKVDLNLAIINEPIKGDEDEEATQITYNVTNTYDKPIDSIIVRLTTDDGTEIEREVSCYLETGESYSGEELVDLTEAENNQEIELSVYEKDQEDISSNTITDTVNKTDISIQDPKVTITGNNALVQARICNYSKWDAGVVVNTSLEDKMLDQIDPTTIEAGYEMAYSCKVPLSTFSCSQDSPAYFKIAAIVENGDNNDEDNIDYAILYDKQNGKSIDKAIVTGIATKIYTGKPQTQKITVKLNEKTLVIGKDYNVSYKNNVNAGKASVIITGIGNCSGTITRTFTISKANNPLAVKGKAAKVKLKKLKKQTQELKTTKVISFTKKGQGKISYKLVSAKKGKENFKKGFKIDAKTGKVMVKKGLKKGTYKVRIKVKAAGNRNYKASAVKTVTFKIKVK